MLYFIFIKYRPPGPLQTNKKENRLILAGSDALRRSGERSGRHYYYYEREKNSSALCSTYTLLYRGSRAIRKANLKFRLSFLENYIQTMLNFFLNYDWRANKTRLSFLRLRFLPAPRVYAISTNWRPMPFTEHADRATAYYNLLLLMMFVMLWCPFYPPSNV
jgi:hypothetical protein